MEDTTIIKNNNRGKAMIIGLLGYILIAVLSIFFIDNPTLKAAIITPLPTIALQIANHYFDGRRNNSNNQ